MAPLSVESLLERTELPWRQSDIVRALSQTAVLRNAALAALLTALACLPRFVLWEKRQVPVWYLALALLLATFVLWAFVFAWHDQYTGRNAFGISSRPQLWFAVTAYGILGAVVAQVLVDPKLRAVVPEDFPTDVKSWLASASFALFFTQLFLILAPVAFFVRLIRKHEAVILLTVLFNVFVTLMKASEVSLPHDLTLQILVVRTIGVTVSVYFYLEGGILMLWWVGLLIHARHLPGLIWP